MESFGYYIEIDEKNSEQISALRKASENANILFRKKETYIGELAEIDDIDSWDEAAAMYGRRYATAEDHMMTLKHEAADFAKSHAKELFTNALTLARIEGVTITTVSAEPDSSKRY